MSTIGRLEPLYLIETGYEPHRDALLLGGCLAVGLTLVVPGLALGTGTPVLVWVALLGVAYATVATAIGRPAGGSYAALLVTGTFAANVPLASTAYLRSMTRDIGPSVWLVHVALVPLLTFLILIDRDKFRQISREEILLGSFVGWIVIAAVVGDPPRPDTAVFFALFVLTGGVVYAAVRRSHRILAVSPRTTLSVLGITVALKSAFGIVEALNGGSFGLTTLGELGPDLAVRIATISLGPVELPVGTFVSGFSGMSFLLASIVVLVTPFLLSEVMTGDQRTRIAATVALVVALAALRLGGSDAARGAVLLALALFVGGVAWTYLQRGIDPDARRLVVVALVLVSLVGIALVPSTQAGAGDEVSLGRGAGSAVLIGGTPLPGGEQTVEVSVPYFDLSNLGVRVEQYVLGVRLFVDNPVFGIGGANFPYVGQTYGLTEGFPIHNIYISLLAETGLVGFLLYVGFLLVVLRRGIGSLGGDPDATMFRIAVLTGLIGYLGFMFWDYMLFDSVVSSTVFYALCATTESE